MQQEMWTLHEIAKDFVSFPVPGSQVRGLYHSSVGAGIEKPSTRQKKQFPRPFVWGIRSPTFSGWGKNHGQSWIHKNDGWFARNLFEHIDRFRGTIYPS